MTAPNYLADHADLYTRDARAAAIEWFRSAKYGLFMHYGLYSLLGRHEWVQLNERIRPGDYAHLAHHFIADRFDADAIADFAVDCGMKYINITTRHHDGFCLWDTKQSTFNSVNAPCGRDLVGELAIACDKRSLGLCLYYSHGRDWKHPHAPDNADWGGHARPEYDPPEPTYACGAGHDLNIYVDFMKAQIHELLTQYGRIAAIWLDGIMTPLLKLDGEGNKVEGFDPRTDGDVFRCQELYDHIHATQPQCLVSYKQGYLGTEDFFAPEHKAYNRFGDEVADRPTEICTTSGGGWGYTAGHEYFTIDQLWQRLVDARENRSNLLMNVGPLPSGALPKNATATLRAVGERIRNQGFSGN